MKITIKYDRKDFFGTCLYCEDYKNDVDINDLKKAFAALKKDNNTALEIDNYILMWDSYTDFEHGVLQCYEYESVNSRKEYVWDFDGCKNFFYDLLKKAN